MFPEKKEKKTEKYSVQWDYGTSVAWGWGGG